MFSSWQDVTWERGDIQEKERKYQEAVEQVRFMIKIYKHQIREGRLFSRERPIGASSWGLEEMRKLMQEEDVVENEEENEEENV